MVATFAITIAMIVISSVVATVIAKFAVRDEIMALVVGSLTLCFLAASATVVRLVLAALIVVSAFVSPENSSKYRSCDHDADCGNA